jgi:hypothetical protein
VATAAEKEELRGGIESTHNVAREAIEKQYIEDKNALEDQYHADLKANEETKRAALVAAGLNSDGSDPQGRPTG